MFLWLKLGPKEIQIVIDVRGERFVETSICDFSNRFYDCNLIDDQFNTHCVTL